MENRPERIERLRNILESSPTARNILKVSIGDVAAKVFSVATAFLLIRSLSISDYAGYITFSAISVLFPGLVGAGVNMAVVRFSTDHLSQGREKPLALYFFAILIQLTIYTMIAGICFLLPGQITALLFGQQSSVISLQLGLLAGLGVLIIQFARSLYQAEEKFNNYVGTLWLVQILIFASLAALRILQNLSFVPVAIVFAAIQSGLGLWILINYLKDFGPHRLIHIYSEQKDQLKQFAVGSGWLIGYFLMLTLLSRMDVLMLLHFRGEEDLAIYGVAFQYYSLALLFLGSIHAVLLPKFARSDMQNPERQRAFLKRWIKWSAWLAVPIILFDIFGRPLFLWINGQEYAPSFTILIILSVGIWLSMMVSPLVNIVLSRGKYRFLFNLSVLGLLFNFASNILLIPAFGGMGAALVIILTQNIFIQIPILLEGLRSA